MRENRGPWYLLTGLALGLIIGLAYAWLVRPVQYTNTAPASLRSDFKDQYRVLIASAYASNGDLVRARARLELLQDEDAAKILAEQAQRKLAQDGSTSEARALGLLAVALGEAPPTAVQPDQSSEAPQDESGGSPTPSGGANLTPSPTTVGDETSTPSSPTTSTPEEVISDTLAISATLTTTPDPTRTPFLTNTPLATRTPTPTQGAPFVLQSRESVCDPKLEQALIQVEAYDAAEQPVSGVEAIVNWEGGENHFFTGLKPELSLGYADFIMTPGINYSLRLAEGGQPITDLAAAECEDQDQERYWGSWLLVFVQP